MRTDTDISLKCRKIQRIFVSSLLCFQIRNYTPLFFLAVVTGVSMSPSLNPGDRLVVRRIKHPGVELMGRIVVARDPRENGNLVIKRFAGLDGDSFILLGDNPEASTDSRFLGSFASDSLMGRVVYRYFPLNAAGRIR